jgi:probable rRNA maturation factor
MIDIDNQTQYKIDEDSLEKILTELTQKDIELILTSNETIQAINKEYRGIDKATDVLSFPYEDMPMAPLGSIVISIDFVQQKAKEFGHSQDDEFALLFIHGLLHLLGYDHECDNGEMRQKEEALIQKLQLPESLIVRTEG